MEHWLLVDSMIVLAYGFQHSILTTRLAVGAFEKLFPGYLWNIVYSLIAVLTLYIGFQFWEPSGVYLYYLTTGSFGFHACVIGLGVSLFMFFYCFRFTTSFWQWLGVKQVVFKALNKNMPAYYMVRKNGIKKYIRFPHHTCLIMFFWLHPVMTLDTLFLAVSATIYLYVGTYHQDLRGLRIIGDEWALYRQNTSLLFPSLKVLARAFCDFKTMLVDGKSSSGSYVEKV